MKQWTAKWIGFPRRYMIDNRRRTLPAPDFRREFIPEYDITDADIFICGLGYFEWSINGENITGDMLVPSPTQYDLRWRYMKYKLPFTLKKGKKYIFSVTVGNGLYNCQTLEKAWHFPMADWRDYPKMIFQLESGGIPLLCSDSNWIVSFSATRYDSLRGGEIYDARLELPYMDTLPEAVRVPRAENWIKDVEPEETGWRHAWIVSPPGGKGEEQIFPGCRIQQRNTMQKKTPEIWASPVNAAGIPEIKVRGERGASITLICGERLSQDSLTVDNREIGRVLMPGEHFQEDTYILKGGETETWHPRFTFHGFQYVQVKTEGCVQLLEMQQLVLFTNVAKHGTITTSDSRLKTIEDSAIRACLSNFCGFPTDCPHREKNGWTSEAMLMCRALLFSRDLEKAYAAYMDTIVDTQRPSGQISGIAPSAGWGYNWGSGGHWDFALFDIPFTLWQFSGNKEYLNKFYKAMKLNLDFQEQVSENGINYSLGDWLPPVRKEEPVGSCASAFRIASYKRLISIARILEDEGTAQQLEKECSVLIEEYNRNFYLGDGIYKGSRTTYNATALNYEIVPEKDRQQCLMHLKKLLTENDFKVDYGTIGSRQVLRALFENGLADEAFQLMTQPNFPGYLYMASKSTTFTEEWDMLGNSLNHGAFSDIVACMYEYIAGFRINQPGIMRISPMPPEGLSDFSAEYKGFKSEWRRNGEKIEYTFTIPLGMSAEINLRDRRSMILHEGIHSFTEQK